MNSKWMPTFFMVVISVAQGTQNDEIDTETLEDNPIDLPLLEPKYTSGYCVENSNMRDALKHIKSSWDWSPAEGEPSSPPGEPKFWFFGNQDLQGSLSPRTALCWVFPEGRGHWYYETQYEMRPGVHIKISGNDRVDVNQNSLTAYYEGLPSAGGHVNYKIENGVIPYKGANQDQPIPVIKYIVSNPWFPVDIKTSNPDVVFVFAAILLLKTINFFVALNANNNNMAQGLRQVANNIILEGKNYVAPLSRIL